MSPATFFFWFIYQIEALSFLFDGIPIVFWSKKNKKKVMTESNSAIFQTFQLCPDTFGHNFFFGFVDQKTIGISSSRKDIAWEVVLIREVVYNIFAG